MFLSFYDPRASPRDGSTAAVYTYSARTRYRSTRQPAACAACVHHTRTAFSLHAARCTARAHAHTHTLYTTQPERGPPSFVALPCPALPCRCAQWGCVLQAGQEEPTWISNEPSTSGTLGTTISSSSSSSFSPPPPPPPSHTSRWTRDR